MAVPLSPGLGGLHLHGWKLCTAASLTLQGFTSCDGAKDTARGGCLAPGALPPATFLKALSSSLFLSSACSSTKAWINGLSRLFPWRPAPTPTFSQISSCFQKVYSRLLYRYPQTPTLTSPKAQLRFLPRINPLIAPSV